MTLRTPFGAALFAAILTAGLPALLAACLPVVEPHPLPPPPPSVTPPASPPADETPTVDPWAEAPAPASPNGTEAVVMTSDGRFVASLTAGPGGRCLTVADLETLEVTRRGDLCGLRALSAGAPGRLLALSADGATVWGVDPLAGAVHQVYTSGVSFTSLTVAPDGAQLALANLPETPGQLVAWEQDLEALPLRRVVLVDVASGAAQPFVTAWAARDVDFTPTRMVVTTSYWNQLGLPRALLQIFQRDGMTYETELEFANCADDLRLQPGGNLAALAPRTCHLRDVVLAQPEVAEPWEDWSDVPPPAADPISLVDLDTITHLGNLPGFGPAEWSADGARVAGFVDRDTLMVEWNTFIDAPFGVVTVDAATLKWRVTEVGDTRPDYRFAPSGAALFVRTTAAGAPRLGRVDVATGALTELGGAPVRLGQSRALTDDAALYVADASALHRLTPDAAAVAPLAPGLTGDHLLASPDDGLLVFTDRVAGAHHVLTPWFDDPAVTLTLPGPILGE